MDILKTYYLLTKPGIVYGNAIAAIGGFLLASGSNIDVVKFLAMLIGTSLIIASACVFNNYLDRNIDRKMKRTQNRALAAGAIPVTHALTFASLLGVIGIFILTVYTNALTVLVGLIGILVYVIVYGYFKRRSVHGTLVGSISGAVPPVAGYVAVTNNLDTAALLLFCILVVWQMPHFYAIAIMGLKGYKAAGIPVLPVEKGIPAAKKHILFYAIAFIPVTLLLTVFGYTGYIYFFAMGAIGVYWVWIGINGFRSDNDFAWAKRMFRFSLITLLAFCLLISAEVVLP